MAIVLPSRGKLQSRIKCRCSLNSKAINWIIVQQIVVFNAINLNRGSLVHRVTSTSSYSPTLPPGTQFQFNFIREIASLFVCAHSFRIIQNVKTKIAFISFSLQTSRDKKKKRREKIFNVIKIFSIFSPLLFFSFYHLARNETKPMARERAFIPCYYEVCFPPNLSILLFPNK